MSESCKITITVPGRKPIIARAEVCLTPNGLPIAEIYSDEDLSFHSLEGDEFYDSDFVKEIITYAMVEGRVTSDSWQSGLNFSLEQDIVDLARIHDDYDMGITP